MNVFARGSILVDSDNADVQNTQGLGLFDERAVGGYPGKPFFEVFIVGRPEPVVFSFPLFEEFPGFQVSRGEGQALTIHGQLALSFVRGGVDPCQGFLMRGGPVSRADCSRVPGDGILGARALVLDHPQGD